MSGFGPSTIKHPLVIHASDRVGVRLTDLGKTHYRDYTMRAGKGRREPPVDPNGISTFTLSELFAIYAGPIPLSNAERYFEDGAIHILALQL